MLLDTDSLAFIEKSLTRTEAKKVHKDLPEGGAWRTMNGHHIYIVNGKIVAGSVPGVTKAKKMTKATMAEHQAKVDAEGKKKSAKKPKTTAKKTTGNTKPKPGGSPKGQGSKKATAGKTATAANKSPVKASKRAEAEKEVKAAMDSLKPKKVAPKKKAPPKQEHIDVYHGTRLPNVDSILKNGFEPNGTEDDFGDAAYFKSPSYDSFDHADHQKQIDKFKASGFSQDAVKRMESRRGNDTETIVGGFSKGKEPAVIHATIPKEHVLDCSQGRPKALQDVIDDFNRARRPVERIKAIFKHLMGEDLSSMSENDAHDYYTKRKADIQKALGKERFIAGKISPYEVYAKKHGIKAIVDKLDHYDDEGWQLGVYDPSIIKVHSHGKGIKWNEDKKMPELIKALLKEGKLPYCLLHSSMGTRRLHLFIGATGGKTK